MEQKKFFLELARKAEEVFHRESDALIKLTEHPNADLLDCLVVARKTEALYKKRMERLLDYVKKYGQIDEDVELRTIVKTELDKGRDEQLKCVDDLVKIMSQNLALASENSMHVFDDETRRSAKTDYERITNPVNPTLHETYIAVETLDSVEDVKFVKSQMDKK